MPRVFWFPVWCYASVKIERELLTSQAGHQTWLAGHQLWVWWDWVLLWEKTRAVHIFFMSVVFEK